MARPVDFGQSNVMFVAPACGDLHAYVDDDSGEIVSCWELDGEELMEVLRTKRIWLRIVSSEQPPVTVQASNPFGEPA